MAGGTPGGRRVLGTGSAFLLSPLLAGPVRPGRPQNGSRMSDAPIGAWERPGRIARRFRRAFAAFLMSCPSDAPRRRHIAPRIAERGGPASSPIPSRNREFSAGKAGDLMRCAHYDHSDFRWILPRELTPVDFSRRQRSHEPRGTRHTSRSVVAEGRGAWGENRASPRSIAASDFCGKNRPNAGDWPHRRSRERETTAFGPGFSIHIVDL